MSIQPIGNTKLFNHVRQRGTGDCGLACLAMMVGMSWDDTLAVVFKGIFDHQPGMSDAQLMGALGFHFGLNVNKADGWLQVIPGICSVPSLTKPGRLHYVFWTGRRVMDPQDGNKIGDAKWTLAPIYTDEMMHHAVFSQIYSLQIRGED